MHTTGAPQLTIVELIDALEAKIEAMRGRNGEPAPPRTNGRPHPKRTHPFSNIEEL
jgi:hypothetical protein